MTNRQLIKSAHVWALTALLALGLWAIAGKAGIKVQDQNQNQNSNSNTNPGNANRTQNDNRSANRNTRGGGAQGSQVGMSSQDRNFAEDAAMGGMMEVELGRVAAQRGTSEAVKQFGQRMVDDHSAANQELMSLASSKGIRLPTALDEKHQEHVTKLSAMSGAEFDRAYSKMMLSDHEKDVKAFERQSSKGGDADLRAFATKTLPTLQQHLEMARALPGNESRGGNNNNSGGSKNSNRNSNGNANSNRP
jgi:putative membrane protein